MQKTIILGQDWLFKIGAIHLCFAGFSPSQRQNDYQTGSAGLGGILAPLSITIATGITGSGDIEVRLAASPAYDLTLTSALDNLVLDFNTNPVEGTFEFTALERGGRIISPFGFDRGETFSHDGQTYVRNTFSRGTDVPSITLATASGKVELKW